MGKTAQKSHNMTEKDGEGTFPCKHGHLLENYVNKDNALE